MRRVTICGGPARTTMAPASTQCSMASAGTSMLTSDCTWYAVQPPATDPSSRRCWPSVRRSPRTATIPTATTKAR